MKTLTTWVNQEIEFRECREPDFYATKEYNIFDCYIDGDHFWCFTSKDESDGKLYFKYLFGVWYQTDIVNKSGTNLVEYLKEQKALFSPMFW